MMKSVRQRDFSLHVKHLQGHHIFSIAEFETAETKTAREKTENEDCIKKRQQFVRRPCEAVLQSGVRKRNSMLHNSPS